MTLFVCDCFSDVKNTKTLTKFGEALEKADFTVDYSASEAKVPILKVQKDPSSGVHFHIDVSVNNHSAVHKSRRLRDLLANIPGAQELAFLVKMWTCYGKLQGPGFLSSHGWMLLVVEFCSQPLSSKNEIAFFSWFIQEYPCDGDWTIGAREWPCDFEEDNVALNVKADKKKTLVRAALKAIERLRDKDVPWERSSE